MKVAFQGELGAYSELATYEIFGEDTEVLPKETFDEIFEAVASGEADRGVIPIENSLAGSIHENYDLLLKHDLQITAELKLRIAHNLIANEGATIESIKKVFSHPQAISQCKSFFADKKWIALVNVYDTAGAAKMVRDSGSTDVAAIASSQAARDYGLNILASGIESNHLNYTRFLALSKEPGIKSDNSKTSIVFSTRNIPGALFKSLSVFALRDIDLYKIESRPVPGSPWEYMFYVDFDGDIRDEKTVKALSHLEEIASYLKCLGSYPKGPETVSRPHERNNVPGK
jgi:prephenate dehydratase